MASAQVNHYITLEGSVNERFAETHLNSDTDFLTTYYCSYLLALLLDEDIQEARALLDRVPSSLFDASTLLQCCIKLVQAVWNRKYALVFEILKSRAILAEKFRDVTINQIALSYATIRLSSIIPSLGIEADSNSMEDTDENVSSQVIKLLCAKDWGYDADTQLFRPKPVVNRLPDVSSEHVKFGQFTSVIRSHALD
ncbi:hypothetical protein FQN57_006143 [Myotisia sp. PD_48]|nr:hypothetical protein FQN57_006143 [Myotisia sp. PD_48]